MGGWARAQTAWAGRHAQSVGALDGSWWQPGPIRPMQAKLGTEASGRSGGLGVAFSDLGAAAAAAVPKAHLRRCRRYCPVSATATLARPAASGRVGCPHRQRADFLSWYPIALRQQLSVIAPARCGREPILVAMP